MKGDLAMDTKTLVSQMIDVQKSSFDNGYETIITLQDQAEKIVNAFLDQATWIPSESRGAMSEWTNMYKKGRDDFRKLVDDGYNKVGGYVSSIFSGLQQ
jgi:hypothetical protein